LSQVPVTRVRFRFLGSLRHNVIKIGIEHTGRKTKQVVPRLVGESSSDGGSD